MGSTTPSFAELIQDTSPEWLPFVIISTFLMLGMIVLDVYTVIQHKKYSTKLPLQFISTVGILQVFPFFAIMQFIGFLVPRAHDVTLFFTEAYESLSFVFFLKLVITYMGGKKITKSVLKGDVIHLNFPPICCFFCLPSVKFTRKFFIFCEVLIGVYVFFCFFVGFVELILTLDDSETYPSKFLTGLFGAVYHVVLVVLLFLAIYGLSGIYHSAEDKLKHRGILEKFLIYKVFTLSVKLEDIILGTLVHHEVIDNEHFQYNEYFTAGLRTRHIYAFVVVIQAMIAFPFAIKFYSTQDYAAVLDMEGSENTMVVDKKEGMAEVTEL